VSAREEMSAEKIIFQTENSKLQLKLGGFHTKSAGLESGKIDRFW
jgi:hypothetical protein